MEDQCSYWGWDFYYQEEGIEELRNTLLYTTLQLEATLACANDELARKSDELLHLKSLLAKTLKERDEAQFKCQKLVLDNLILQQHHQQQQVIEDDPFFGVDSSSGSDEHPPPLVLPTGPEATKKFAHKHSLPERGKFLQAVMEAGPLLQTLLLAGPLPQWQHPPPQLNSIAIPPVTIGGCGGGSSGSDSMVNRKRGLEYSDELSDDSSLPQYSKNQKFVHQSLLTKIIQ